MKQLLYLVIIYIVVAACSGQHEANSTLNRVATLLDNRPDTSVTVSNGSAVARNAMQEKKYRVRAVLLYLAGIACFIAYCYFANLFPRFFEIVKNIITFLSN